MQANVKATAVLLNHGANVNAVDSSGQTALMMAAISGQVELVKLLLLDGARKDIKSQYGKTAADFATAFRFEDIVALLH